MSVIINIKESNGEYIPFKSQFTNIILYSISFCFFIIFSLLFYRLFSIINIFIVRTGDEILL